MSPRSLASLSPPHRRRALIHLVARVVLVWLGVLGAYFVLPDGSESTFQTVVRVLVVVALTVGVIVWQSRRILGADLPEIRAIEALGTILIIFLVLFASLYLAMW